MTLRVSISVPEGQHKAAAIVTYDRATVTPSGGIVLQPGQATELVVHAGTELRIGETDAATPEALPPAAGGPEVPGAAAPAAQVGDSAA